MSGAYIKGNNPKFTGTGRNLNTVEWVNVDNRPFVPTGRWPDIVDKPPTFPAEAVVTDGIAENKAGVADNKGEIGKLNEKQGVLRTDVNTADARSVENERVAGVQEGKLTAQALVDTGLRNDVDGHTQTLSDQAETDTGLRNDVDGHTRQITAQALVDAGLRTDVDSQGRKILALEGTSDTNSGTNTTDSAAVATNSRLIGELRTDVDEAAQGVTDNAANRTNDKVILDARTQGQLRLDTAVRNTVAATTTNAEDIVRVKEKQTEQTTAIQTVTTAAAESTRLELASRPVIAKVVADTLTNTNKIAELSGSTGGGADVAATDVVFATYQPADRTLHSETALVQPVGDVAGATDIGLGSIAPFINGVTINTIPTGTIYQLSFIVEHSYPRETSGTLPTIAIRLSYGQYDTQWIRIPITSNRQAISVALPPEYSYDDEDEINFAASIANTGATPDIAIDISELQVDLTGVLYAPIEKLIDDTVTKEDAVLLGKIQAGDKKSAGQQAGIDANAAGLAHINDHGAKLAPTLELFADRLETTSTSTLVPTYNSNQNVTPVPNVSLIAASGYDGVAIGASNLTGGTGLGDDGTYYRENNLYDLTAGSIQSFIFYNSAGIANTTYDNGLIRFTSRNSTPPDKWRVSTENGKIGIVRTVLNSADGSQQLFFFPFANQPEVSDTLIITLHFKEATQLPLSATWQLVARDGNGAILERAEIDVGKYSARNLLWFTRDATQYQRLSFDSASSGEITLETLAALNNNAERKGFGLFTFSNEIFDLGATGKISAESIHGLEAGTDHSGEIDTLQTAVQLGVTERRGLRTSINADENRITNLENAPGATDVSAALTQLRTDVDANVSSVAAAKSTADTASQRSLSNFQNYGIIAGRQTQLRTDVDSVAVTANAANNRSLSNFSASGRISGRQTEFRNEIDDNKRRLTVLEDAPGAIDNNEALTQLRTDVDTGATARGALRTDLNATNTRVKTLEDAPVVEPVDATAVAHATDIYRTDSLLVEDRAINQPNDDTGATGVTNIVFARFTPSFDGITTIPPGARVQLSGVVDYSFPQGTSGSIPSVLLNVDYFDDSISSQQVAIESPRDQASIILDEQWDHEGSLAGLVISMDIRNKGATPAITVELSGLKAVLTGVLYEPIEALIKGAVSTEDGILLGRITDTNTELAAIKTEEKGLRTAVVAGAGKNISQDTDIANNTATGAANATAIANLNAQDGLPPALASFGQHLIETDNVNGIPKYNPYNGVDRFPEPYPTLTAASGFDGDAIGASHLTKGADLADSGSYYSDSELTVLSINTVQSYIINNSSGEDNATGFLRVRNRGATGDDTLALASLGGLYGWNLTVPAHNNGVPAHKQYVSLANNAPRGVIPHTEETADGIRYVAQDIVFKLPDYWTIDEEITIELGLSRNGGNRSTATRNDIFIAQKGTDQDDYIGGDDSRFNITLGGTTFTGLFDWFYRGSDNSIIVRYSPQDHPETLTTDWTVKVFFPAAAHNDPVAEHLAFVPLTHQPATHSDALHVTLHYTGGTTWQAMITDGNGAVLERREVDAGKFAATDQIFFTNDTTQYQRLTLGASSLPLHLDVFTALHNQADVKGYSLFSFTDGIVYKLGEDAKIDGGSLVNLSVPLPTLYFPRSITQAFSNHASIILIGSGSGGGTTFDVFNKYDSISLVISDPNSGSMFWHTMPTPHAFDRFTGSGDIEADTFRIYTSGRLRFFWNQNTTSVWLTANYTDTLGGLSGTSLRYRGYKLFNN